MAPSSLWKHSGPAGNPRALLRQAAAALIVVVFSLALPGAAVAQGPQPGQGVIIPREVAIACSGFGALGFGNDLVECATMDEQGVRDRCCNLLRFKARAADGCACGVLKIMTTGDRGINLDNVCGATGIGKECQARAEEARRAEEKKAEEEGAAKEREGALSKLDTCDHFFERMADKDLSKLDPADARACILAMKMCPASCNN